MRGEARRPPSTVPSRGLAKGGGFTTVHTVERKEESSPPHTHPARPNYSQGFHKPGYHESPAKSHLNSAEGKRDPTKISFLRRWVGWSAKGADNPAVAAQGRGLGSSGISIPLSRSIQVLRGVCTGLDPSAGLASQKPEGHGAQGLCREPCIPTTCLGC